MRGLCTEGNLLFKIDWASFLSEGNLPFLLCFTLYSRANSKYKLPGGGLIFGGAYKWRGLFSEFYGVPKFRERKRKSLSFNSRPPQNVKLDNLTSWSCSDCKEIYKKARRAKLLFW